MFASDGQILAASGVRVGPGLGVRGQGGSGVGSGRGQRYGLNTCTNTATILSLAGPGPAQQTFQPFEEDISTKMKERVKQGYGFNVRLERGSDVMTVPT